MGLLSDVFSVGFGGGVFHCVISEKKSSLIINCGAWCLKCCCTENVKLQGQPTVYYFYWVGSLSFLLQSDTIVHSLATIVGVTRA